MEYITRYAERHIKAIDKTFKVLYVGGPRQVGKTTMLRHLAANLDMNYVSLDDLEQRRLARTDPQLFLDEHPKPLFIDEVQYAPELFSYIKLRVDEDESPGQYWLTGSQQFSLLKNVQESLAGRVGILHLLGLSLAEAGGVPDAGQPFLPSLLRTEDKQATADGLFEALVRGWYPRLWQKNAPASVDFYKSYLQTYVDRDIRALFGVEKTQAFHMFVKMCATRTGQMLNVTDLARDTGISVNAARAWLSILESTMQIYLLRPYHRNITKRSVKAPKLYMLDTGLAAYLAGWQDGKTLRHSAYAGAFFETFVVSELIKSYLFRGQEPPLHYFRDKEGHEIDVLIEHAQKLYPIEIKMKQSVTVDDIRGLVYARKRYPQISQGTVFSLVPKRIPLDRNTDVLPISALS